MERTSTTSGSAGTIRRRLAAVLVATFAAALVAGTQATAMAATATGQERAITLAERGVVFVDTAVHVDVTLTYQDASNISGLSAASRGYDLDYGTGSGFVVDPAGTIVTASHVVEPKAEDLQRYAANQLLFGDLLTTFGYGLGPGDDLFGEYTINDNAALNTLLQQCYSGTACHFSFTPSVSVYTAVQIAGTQTAHAMPARVLDSTGFDNTDVAVLQVTGHDMPTVDLAGSAGDLQSGQDITALGFPGSATALPTGVTEPTKVFGHISNIRSVDSSQLIEIDADTQPGMSGGPVIDGRGRVIGLTSFALLQSNGIPGAKYLRTVDDIRTALHAAGVQPSRGVGDATFARAMNDIWASHYSAAIPLLDRVLALSPGDPIAQRYLTEAQAKAGTAADAPLPKPSGGFPMPILIAIAAIIAAGAVGAWVATRRRRQAMASSPSGADLRAPSAVGFTVEAGTTADALRWMQAVGISPAQPDGSGASSRQNVGP